MALENLRARALQRRDIHILRALHEPAHRLPDEAREVPQATEWGGVPVRDLSRLRKRRRLTGNRDHFPDGILRKSVLVAEDLGLAQIGFLYC